MMTLAAFAGDVGAAQDKLHALDCSIRRCAIMFSGTPYSSITFFIAVRSSGASTIPTNRAGVPLI
jgi:hypothetical protein